MRDPDQWVTIMAVEVIFPFSAEGFFKTRVDILRDHSRWVVDIVVFVYTARVMQLDDSGVECAI